MDLKVPFHSRKEIGTGSQKKRDPVRKVVGKAVAQATRKHERRATPWALEPVEQIDPRSYIGKAFERLLITPQPRHFYI